MIDLNSGQITIDNGKYILNKELSRLAFDAIVDRNDIIEIHKTEMGHHFYRLKSQMIDDTAFYTMLHFDKDNMLKSLSLSVYQEEESNAWEDRSREKAMETKKFMIAGF